MQHYNDPKHRYNSKCMTEWLKEKRIRVFPQPSRSTHFNPDLINAESQDSCAKTKASKLKGLKNYCYYIWFHSLMNWWVCLKTLSFTWMWWERLQTRWMEEACGCVDALCVLLSYHEQTKSSSNFILSRSGLIQTMLLFYFEFLFIFWYDFVPPFKSM